MNDFQYDKDDAGIVTVTMDFQGQSANTMNKVYLRVMDEITARLQAETGLTGVVLTSAKKTFFAGGDLHELLAIERVDQALFDWIEHNKAGIRALERLPVPVVAAINGAALGGGFEICLGCNHRIVVDAPSAVVGLPEVTLGLLPGGGGVVGRTARVGREQALPQLAEALKAGLVDALVPRVEDLVPAAKAWIQAHPQAHAQPWDAKGFKYPGGDAAAPHIRQLASMAAVSLAAKTRGLAPAPARILDLAVNSMRMGFESALRAESRALASLPVTPEAKAAIGTFFFGMQAVKSGRVRPPGERWKAQTTAVLGAGMMGAGIAWAHATKGLRTALKDTEQERADKGRAYSATLADKAIKRGSMSEADKAALLELIVPTTQDGDCRGADVIIEAVFEDITLKESVIPQTFGLLAEGGIYGSNTSTLPISILAESCPDPSRFIGLHFFSPVDRMKIVEIIIGAKTSQDTLRKAYDYVQHIGYLPIVVNDARGFFTSRVFGTFLDEGMQLLQDGMDPVTIERAAWKVGMPVGPLAVHDEVSLELTRKAMTTHRQLDQRLGLKQGFGAHNTATHTISPVMCEMGRGGRNWGGRGFYDYAQDGSKRLWDGLAQFKLRDAEVSWRDAQDRLIYRQVIETLRCYDEGVLRSEVEANLGSIVAIGFPGHTGGALQYVRGVGIDAFARRAAELADRYGERFAVPLGALDKLRTRAALEA